MSKKLIIIVLFCAFAGFGYRQWSVRDKAATTNSDIPLYEAEKGTLVIDVMEGGNIHALDYLEVKSSIKLTAGTKILDIIDEGYEVTDDDVKTGKVLVKLDQSGLEEQIVDHDVEFQETQASYAESKQNLDIEYGTQRSKEKLLRQTVRFALLDFQKFVGEKAAREVLVNLKMPYDSESLEQFELTADKDIKAKFNAAKVLADNSEAALNAKGSADKSSHESQASGVDFGSYLEGDRLGEGVAEQNIRKFRDAALLSQQELSLAEESVAGAKRLRDREFITKSSYENELVSLEKAKLALKTAETELDLFTHYEFPKESEKMLSAYEEALLELLRQKREGMAVIARAEAKFQAVKRRYELQMKKREDLESQLASCTIRAERPGLVAYGGAKNDYYSSRYYESIEQGATLKLGQPIITIPNMARLAVDVDIHESHIKKIKSGQSARVTVDAVPGRELFGKVTKVAVLPDSNASRYNPSLKVYPATIEIEGEHDWLKPGMTAKVEIIVNQLADVLFIPVQAVFFENDAHFVHVQQDGAPVKKRIDIGEHNDQFIEVRTGIDAGDVVWLSMPEGYKPAAKGNEKGTVEAPPAQLSDEGSATRKVKEA